MSGLVEIDNLEALIIVDNELDPISPINHEAVKVSGGLQTMAITSPFHLHDRGGAVKEIRMEQICSAAHGLSIMLVRVRGPPRRGLMLMYTRLLPKGM